MVFTLFSSLLQLIDNILTSEIVHLLISLDKITFNGWMRYIKLLNELFLPGTGYVEDGREIFDDDEIEDTYVASSNKESGRGQKRKARVAPPTSKGNIRNLLGSMPTKKKEVLYLIHIKYCI